MKLRFILASLVSTPIIVAISASAQTTAPQQRINIDASAPLVGYMNSASVIVRANTSKGLKQSTMLDIPTFDIYNASGALIYHGTGETKEENRKIVEGLPQSVANLKPLPDRPPLKPLLEILPETRSASNSILLSGHYVVYAVSLQSDHPTTTQTAIATLRAQSATLPVDTISVRLKQ